MKPIPKKHIDRTKSTALLSTPPSTHHHNCWPSYTTCAMKTPSDSHHFPSSPAPTPSQSTLVVDGKPIQFTPVKRSGGDRHDDHPRADAEIIDVPDVEGYVSGLNRSLFPPSERTESTQKRKRCSHNERRKANAAEEVDGGSRLIRNTKASSGNANTRTCLLDSIASIIPPTKNKNELVTAMASSMPSEGDTKVEKMRCALEGSDLELKQVNNKFLKKGGAPYHLFKEDDCRIIIRLRLTDLMGRIIWHFVAWDGDVIFDYPYSNKINMRRDRASPEASNLAFGRLYPKTEFEDWQVTRVYELVDLQEV